MGLFSQYSQEENRVTSTILAILGELNHKVTTFILQGLLEDTSLELIKFENQPTRGKDDSRPDGQIVGSFNYYIETKIKENSVRLDQIQKHLDNRVNEVPQEIKSGLIVLTPDEEKPDCLAGLDKVHWTNFDALVGSIEQILDDTAFHYRPTDREVYLLTELNTFIREKGLLPYDYSKRVMVIANRDYYYSLYEEGGFCIWQPERSFQKSAYMAFYSQNRIRQVVPKILGYLGSVDIKGKKHDSALIPLDPNITKKALKERLNEILELDEMKNFSTNKIIILSKKDDEKTIVLEQEIKNDKKSKNGRGVPFTYGQPRYVELDKLEKAKNTSDLE